jgi:hypothetical protein
VNAVINTDDLEQAYHRRAASLEADALTPSSGSAPVYTTLESYLAALEAHGATVGDLPMLQIKLREAQSEIARMQGLIDQQGFASLSAMVAIIRRIGGYLSPEDQWAIGEAKRLLRVKSRATTGTSPADT